LAARLLDTFQQGVKNLSLIPSGGGVFEVEVDGKLIYSKKATGEFPDEKNLIAEMQKKFAA
jgi:selenoprotein W-related protein